MLQVALHAVGVVSKRVLNKTTTQQRINTMSYQPHNFYIIPNLLSVNKSQSVSSMRNLVPDRSNN